MVGFLFIISQSIIRVREVSADIYIVYFQAERYDLVSAYHRRLTGNDTVVQLNCARRWSVWEMATSRLIVDHDLLNRAESDEWALQFAKIEA